MNAAREFDIIVLGAGIIGLATAWTLQQRRPAARIAVIDKETDVAAHQSSHNSGVVHAGVYYPPDSLKARYCRAGVELTLAFCTEHEIPAQRCGKLIVACDAPETTRLRTLAERARNNGLQCEWLEGHDIADREPAIRGHAALHVAATGIADYAALCRKLAELLTSAGAELVLGEAIERIEEGRNAVRLDSSQCSFTCPQLVVCGGLQADRLARMAGLPLDGVVVPFRGDFFHLPTARAGLVSTLIYPVPDPALPFLGVHLTLTTSGGLMLGPTAMLALARERYTKWALEPRDAFSSAMHPGTWRLLGRYPRAGLGELAHCVSKRMYLRAVRRYCPELKMSDLERYSCGIRAQLVNRRGEMINDFVLEQTARSLHVVNAPSPAATAAFPIAAAIAERVDSARAH